MSGLPTDSKERDLTIALAAVADTIAEIMNRTGVHPERAFGVVLEFADSDRRLIAEVAVKSLNRVYEHFANEVSDG